MYPAVEIITRHLHAEDDEKGPAMNDAKDEHAPDVLVLGYKSVYDATGSHVEAAVRIEGGAPPDPLPTEKRQIVPYSASEMGAGIDLTVPNVATIKPERTFWEKALILVSDGGAAAGTKSARDPGVFEKLLGLPGVSRNCEVRYPTHMVRGDPIAPTGIRL